MNVKLPPMSWYTHGTHLSGNAPLWANTSWLVLFPDSPKSERKAWGSDWHFLSYDGWYEANGGKWEPNLKPSIAFTTELWPSNEHCLSLCTATLCVSGSHRSVSATRTLLAKARQCTIPPHPLACVQRERCLEQSVHHTIQLFDHCANWTGGVWLQFIKVMYTQIYCFVFKVPLSQKLF